MTIVEVYTDMKVVADIATLLQQGKEGGGRQGNWYCDSIRPLKVAPICCQLFIQAFVNFFRAIFCQLFIQTCIYEGGDMMAHHIGRVESHGCLTCDWTLTKKLMSTLHWTMNNVNIEQCSMLYEQICRKGGESWWMLEWWLTLNIIYCTLNIIIEH